MPDLQSELNKLTTLNNLNFDDPGESNEITIVTEDKTKSRTNVIWDYIKAHPSCCVAEAADALGLGRADTSTLFSQLFNRGLVQRVTHNGTFFYTAVGDEFPIYTKEKRMANLALMWEKRSKNRAKRSDAGVKRGAYKKRATVEKPQPIAAAPVNASTLLDTLSIKEARALYDELKKIFGG